MHSYSVTLFDRTSPENQVTVRIWAPTRSAAYERALEHGHVIDVRRAVGTWPLDARKASARVRES